MFKVKLMGGGGGADGIVVVVSFGLFLVLFYVLFVQWSVFPSVHFLSHARSI